MALVSRRFRSLCLAPELLIEIECHCHSHDVNELLKSFLTFLEQHGRHIHGFTLCVPARDYKDLPDLGLILACLITCCTASPLEKLFLSVEDVGGFMPDNGIPTRAWLLPARSTLYELALTTDNCPLNIDASLQLCTALGKLSIDCSELGFSSSAWLPASLTCLYLSLMQQEDGLPTQVFKRHASNTSTVNAPLTHALIGALHHHHPLQIFAAPRLAMLECFFTNCQLTDAPPTVSPSITRLNLIDSFNFSELLLTLPQLRSLTILIEQDDPTGYEEWFAGAATALQQLTNLVQDWHTACVPAEVASMTNLRRLRVHNWMSADPADEPQHSDLALPPPGAWSGGLVALAIDSTVALQPRSKATLRSMSSLQTLQLYCWKEDLAAENAARWAGFLEAVGAMGRLQRLELIHERQAVLMHSDLAAALLAMSTSRRNLAVSVLRDTEHYCVRRWRERWEEVGGGADS